MPMSLKMIPFDISMLPDTPKAFLVGGSVRDLLLGLSSSDYDIAVSENPEKYAKQTARNLSGRLVLMGKPGQEIYRVVTQAFTIDISPVKGSSIQTDLMQRDFTVNAIACNLASGKQIDPLGAKSDLDEKKIRMVSEKAFEKDPIRLLRAFRLSASLNFTIEPKTLAAIGIADGTQVRTALQCCRARRK
jgi:tRNA nucleotidyltransferase/poly(A) polymerase